MPRRMITKLCDECSTPFWFPQNEIKLRRFCSHACAAIGRRIPSTEERFQESPVAPQADGCVLWLGAINNHGYGRFTWSGGEYAHQFSYALAKGEIPDGCEITHTCDNPPCINPDHLIPRTHSGNMKDMMKKVRGGGQYKSGGIGNRKLTIEQVLEIRKMWGVRKPHEHRDVSQKSLSDQFGVSVCGISRIVLNKSYTRFSE